MERNRCAALSPRVPTERGSMLRVAGPGSAQSRGRARLRNATPWRPPGRRSGQRAVESHRVTDSWHSRSPSGMGSPPTHDPWVGFEAHRPHARSWSRALFGPRGHLGGEGPLLRPWLFRAPDISLEQRTPYAVRPSREDNSKFSWRWTRSRLTAMRAGPLRVLWISLHPTARPCRPDEGGLTTPGMRARPIPQEARQRADIEHSAQGR